MGLSTVDKITEKFRDMSEPSIMLSLMKLTVCGVGAVLAKRGLTGSGEITSATQFPCGKQAQNCDIREAISSRNFITGSPLFFSDLERCACVPEMKIG